jgi:DNA-binding winged helix-turn-helix (wHTH) protein
MTAADIKTGTKHGSGFRLRDLQVDPQTGEVSGPGGRVQLDPKVMGVLAMLAERAGQVVPREDLISRLWPDVVVTDDALSRCLYDLRRELAAAGGSDEYRALVETLP